MLFIMTSVRFENKELLLFRSLHLLNFAIKYADMRTDFASVPSSAALLQLKATNRPYCAKETQFVKTACLPKQAFSSGTECVISGWGVTETRKHCVKSIRSAPVLGQGFKDLCIGKHPNTLIPSCCVPWCV